jgi:hypothetical protein
LPLRKPCFTWSSWQRRVPAAPITFSRYFGSLLAPSMFLVASTKTWLNPSNRMTLNLTICFLIVSSVFLSTGWNPLGSCRVLCASWRAGKVRPRYAPAKTACCTRGDPGSRHFIFDPRLLLTYLSMLLARVSLRGQNGWSIVIRPVVLKSCV